MTRSEHINEYFNGRGFMLFCALMLVAVTVVALAIGVEPTNIQGEGIFFTLQGAFIETGPVSAAINVLCLFATGGILLALNKVFTFVRSMTHLFVSAFFLLQLAHPSGLVSLNAGTLLGLMGAVTLMPLFASFQDSHAQRSIFLIFALVATGVMFHYGFLMLIPVYLLGFANMRVLDFKGMLAMLIGLVTPFWIVMGLGITSPSDAHLPQWALMERPQLTIQFGMALATSAIGIALMVMNLLTVVNYRMQPRVYNISLMIMLVMVIITLCLDYHDLAVFLPLLNLMVAVQMAQAYTLGASFRFRNLFVLLLMVVCLAVAAFSILS